LEYQQGVPKQPFPSYSGLWIRATTSDCRTVRTPNVYRTYVCSATTKPVFLSAMQNVLPHVGACKHKIKVEWWRHVHSPGHSGTRLTAYHISRYVASTFKSLATTTTHFDLKAFIKTDRVNFQVMIQHMTLSVILIVVAEM
jgi:hypothetical protein